MARSQFIDVGIDAQGNAVTTTQVTVYQARTTTQAPSSAGPFVNEAGASFRGNPFAATTGDITFWLEPGEYDVYIEDTASPQKFASRTVRVVSLPYGMVYTTANPPPVPNTTKVYRQSHGFSVGGLLQAPANNTTDYAVLPGFYIALAAGESALLIAMRHHLHGGTSVNLTVQRNGINVSGFTNISATTTDTHTDPTDVAVANGDYIQLILSSLTGSPTGLACTLITEHTV